MNIKNLLFVAIAMLLFVGCSDDDDSPNVNDKELTESTWSETMAGRDEVLGQYPDRYSNYWEYTWNIDEAQDVALKMEGEFPYTRYCSFSLYNDNTGEAIGGINDYEMVPDNGAQNPFVVTTAERGRFTVYIVPETASEVQTAALGCENLIRVPADVKKACVVFRHYLGEDAGGNEHEFGGVDLPAISAVSLTTGEKVDCPEHVRSNVYNLKSQVFTQVSDDFADMPFYLSPVGRYYPNNSTKYLYGRTRIQDDQVLYFSFIPAPVPQRVEENADAPARYWSVCLGSAANTRSYLSLCDKNANVASGGELTHFVVALKQNPRLAEVQQYVDEKNATGEHYNLFVWDREKLDVDGNPIGNVIAVMYRNILANKNWRHSIAKLWPTNYKDETGEPYQHITAPQWQVAHLALMDYGPHGIKVTTDEFLSRVPFNNAESYYPIVKGDETLEVVFTDEASFYENFQIYDVKDGRTIDFNKQIALTVRHSKTNRLVYIEPLYLVKNGNTLEYTYCIKDYGDLGSSTSVPFSVIGIDKKWADCKVVVKAVSSPPAE